MNSRHLPVLLPESLKLLKIGADDTVIDATFGSGGHTKAMLSLGANVIAFDWDKEAIERGQQMFAKEILKNKLILIHESFAKMKEEIIQIKPKNKIVISAVLFDFGTSSEQLLSKKRGFSFVGNGPLDMRMDTRLAVMAKDILALVPEKQLEQLFKDFAGETKSRAIARAIKNSQTPITTTAQLVECILQIHHKKPHAIHPATKVFQALRIAVNGELSEIKLALPQALSVLRPEGRIVCISFHEGEDRIVKQQFNQWQKGKKVKKMQKKPLQPSELEVKANPRSRSAKLRAVEKI